MARSIALGINFGAGEAAGTGYYGATADIDVLHREGVRTIRQAFKAKRVIASPGGELLPDVAKLRRIVSYALGKGIKVILDCHDYGRWINKSPDGKSLPMTLGDIPHVVEMWAKLAAPFKTNPLFVPSFMNEPAHLVNDADVWPMQQIWIDGLRSAGFTNQLCVTMQGWAGIRHYGKDVAASKKAAALKDPLNKLLFDGHHYFDGDSSGTRFKTLMGFTHSGQVTEALVLESLERNFGPPTDWARANNKKLLIGEIALPDVSQLGPGKPGFGRIELTLMTAKIMPILIRWFSERTDVFAEITWWHGTTYSPMSIDPFGLMNKDANKVITPSPLFARLKSNWNVVFGAVDAVRAK